MAVRHRTLGAKSVRPSHTFYSELLSFHTLPGPYSGPTCTAVQRSQRPLSDKQIIYSTEYQTSKPVLSCFHMFSYIRRNPGPWFLRCFKHIMHNADIFCTRSNPGIERPCSTTMMTQITLTRDLSPRDV